MTFMFCYSFHQQIAYVASINCWIFVLWNAQFFYYIREESIQSFRIFWLFDRISPFPTRIMLSLFIPLSVKKGVIVFQKVLLSVIFLWSRLSNYSFISFLTTILLFAIEISHWKNSYSLCIL